VPTKFSVREYITNTMLLLLLLLLLLCLAKIMFCFQQCLVACDETESKLLDKALFLKDALDDLPEVGTN
jgi:hypothetical protein